MSTCIWNVTNKYNYMYMHINIALGVRTWHLTVYKTPHNVCVHRNESLDLNSHVRLFKNRMKLHDVIVNKTSVCTSLSTESCSLWRSIYSLSTGLPIQRFCQ